jgi:hypothetical protein
MPRKAPIFPVRVALGDQLDDTALAIGEGCSRSIAPREKRLQQGFRDPVGEKRPVGGQGGNGLEQEELRIGFEEVAARSGAQEVENEASSSHLVKMRISTLGSRLRRCCVTSIPFITGSAYSTTATSGLLAMASRIASCHRLPLRRPAQSG